MRRRTSGSPPRAPTPQGSLSRAAPERRAAHRPPSGGAGGAGTSARSGKALASLAPLLGGDRVADGDRAVGEDVRVEARAVDEVVDDPRARERLEMQARLAELDAVALDLADAEALADEIVEPHPAHRQLSAR